MIILIRHKVQKNSKHFCIILYAHVVVQNLYKVYTTDNYIFNIFYFFFFFFFLIPYIYIK
ncbi:hypothetical protein, partial [Plasmodium yoelii yoelii]